MGWEIWIEDDINNEPRFFVGRYGKAWAACRTMREAHEWAKDHSDFFVFIEDEDPDDKREPADEPAKGESVQKFLETATAAELDALEELANG